LPTVAKQSQKQQSIHQQLPLKIYAFINSLNRILNGLRKS